MDLSFAATLLAILISILAALYARRSASEAKRANDIGRLNALLALRAHYLAQSQQQVELAKIFSSAPSGRQAAFEAFANLDGKIREVSVEIDIYHGSLMRGADKKHSGRFSRRVSLQS